MKEPNFPQEARLSSAETAFLRKRKASLARGRIQSVHQAWCQVRFMFAMAV
jgi:hypothetical protein